jgi:uncharacterized protein
MRAVIDTNVLVSAAINPNGTPGRLVQRIRDLTLTPVVSPDILAEYTEVLNRARFNFPQGLVDDLLHDMARLALHIRPAVDILPGPPDPDDAPFIASARAAACPIVTGNARHFPVEAGVEVLSPAACVERLLKR